MITVLSLWRGHLRAPAGRASDIEKAVAEMHGLSLAEMKGPTRARHVVHARHHAMWELREQTGLSLPSIARRLGRKDHTTVIHGVREHARRMAEARA